MANKLQNYPRFFGDPRSKSDKIALEKKKTILFEKRDCSAHLLFSISRGELWYMCSYIETRMLIIVHSHMMFRPELIDIFDLIVNLKR